MLADVSGGEGGRVPQWQLTHPHPENREAHIREVIAAADVPENARVARDAFLDRIDGLVYGENPRDGYFKDARFVHPEMAFEVRFPEGWTTENQRTAVGAVSPAKDALVVLTLAQGAADPATALRTFLTQEGVRGGRVREDVVYGEPSARASFVATTADGELSGEALFVRHRDMVFRVVAYAAPGKWNGYAAQAGRTLDSFAPLGDAAILAAEPARIEVVRVSRTMSLEDFNATYPSVVSLEELARINRLHAGATVAAGTRLKRVAGKPLP
jgi:predicted Zn-dependent protease